MKASLPFLVHRAHLFLWQPGSREERQTAGRGWGRRRRWRCSTKDIQRLCCWCQESSTEPSAPLQQQLREQRLPANLAPLLVNLCTISWRVCVCGRCKSWTPNEATGWQLCLRGRGRPSLSFLPQLWSPSSAWQTVWPTFLQHATLIIKCQWKVPRTWIVWIVATEHQIGEIGDSGFCPGDSLWTLGRVNWME